MQDARGGLAGGLAAYSSGLFLRSSLEDTRIVWITSYLVCIIMMTLSKRMKPHLFVCASCLAPIVLQCMHAARRTLGMMQGLEWTQSPT